MKGKIIKGIAGFYYVYHKGTFYECKAKGIFRKDNVKPLVGDDVEFTILSEEKQEGNIDKLLERKSELIRPAVANIDRALVVFAAKKPAPNLNLLDRFLLMMKMQEIPVIICFNKLDIASDEDVSHYREIYEKAGYDVIFASTYEEHGMDEIKSMLKGKTSTLAGPSGVGKSSIVNILCPEANMNTGVLSRKIDRGKHTTRHSEILPIDDDTYIIDTPGFSSIYLPEIEAEELKEYYDDFLKFEPGCRFAGCNHMDEPDCGVKQAVSDGDIASERYENYRMLFAELKDRKKY